MTIAVYLLFLSLLIVIPTAESTLLCRSCTQASRPSQCDTIVRCQAGENCLIEKIDDHGHIYYNGRCVSSSNCPSTPGGQSPVPVGRRRRFLTDTVSHVCIECCSHDHCNTMGCGSQELECRDRLKDGYFYDSLSNVCAKVVKSPNRAYNQREAEAVCELDGAKLIAITSEEEQYFIISWIFTHFQKDQDFWIGLKSSGAPNKQYVWPMGESITYKNWGRSYPEQPSDVWTGDEDCVFINSKDDNSWHDDRCDRQLSGYICQIWDVSQPTATIKSRCRQAVMSGYLYDQTTDICIKLKESNLDQFTQAMAVKDCQKDGATLAIIDTQQKQDLINWWIYSTKDNGTDFWIGAQDLSGTNSVFVWPTGANVSSTYTHWGGPDLSSSLQSQPDGFNTSKNERCVYMESRQQFKWFDANCGSLKTGFICQHFGNTSFMSESIDNCLFRLQRGYFYDPCTRMCIQVKDSPNPVSRYRADEICRLNGDRLVEIDSQEKMTYVTYMTQSLQKSQYDFWIGAIESGPTGHGQFIWEYTGRPLQYTNWFTTATQPVRDCVILDHTDHFRWSPTECASRKHGYICQLDDAALASSRG